MTENHPVDPRLVAFLSNEPDAWLVTDETETVHVSVGVDGTLATLRLTPSWWRRVPSEEVGSVILRLRGQSAGARLRTISELEDDAGAAPDDDAPPALFRPRDAGTENPADLTRRMHDVLAAFADLDRYRREVTAAATESATLTSPSGNVTLELIGGRPRRLAIDPYNVQFTSEHALAADIVELFHRADRWFADRRRAVFDELPALADVVRSVRGPGRGY
ncbi:hypothetical protein ET445_05525 [Agromyces protaetiae]|uniref:Uncharacterized protein n=1 Tax=Agromyces protaetiae TaxID=2509455 RepID=A0A4V0YGZ0_9MICO|nr:hypothetical protein [Agromyces protaetiae]QAY72881.1 hypothetical protein ET445_05525 [Agromyces protaetiae]